VHVIVWEYEVAAGCEHAFERAYGPQGDWARLFRTHGGYLGTELVRSDRPDRYVTIDRWAAEDDVAAFLARRRAEYEALDARCDAFTVAERRVVAGPAEG
jgi:heme-degrading monooxygenase HmoA